MGAAIRESAVEIELPLNENIVNYITTESGTLRGLYKKTDKIPSAILNWLEGQSIKGNVLDISLEILPADLKLMALQAGIIAKKLKFGSSREDGRKIPGLKIKDIYQKQYNLLPTVELGAPSTTVDARLIEIHMRAAVPPGDLAKQAAQFQKILGYKPGPLHMHIVFDLPKRWLSGDPVRRAWFIFDYWRRLNLTMEMRDVFENGRGLITNKSDFKGSRYTNFAPAGQFEYEAVLSYLVSVGISETSRVGRKPLEIKSDGKMGWIGFWGHDKYDQPNLFGFELRFLEGTDLPENLVSVINQIPSQVQNRKFGIDENKMDTWAEMASYFLRKESAIGGITGLFTSEKYPATNRGIVSTFLNPHRSYQELFEPLPYEFKRILLGIDKDKVQDAFNNYGRLRYLIHDWSLDPIFYDKPEQTQTIRNFQLQALRRWARGEDEKNVLEDFLLNSGIYAAFADSLGLKI